MLFQAIQINQDQLIKRDHQIRPNTTCPHFFLIIIVTYSFSSICLTFFIPLINLIARLDCESLCHFIRIVLSMQCHYFWIKFVCRCFVLIVNCKDRWRPQQGQRTCFSGITTIFQLRFNMFISSVKCGEFQFQFFINQTFFQLGYNLMSFINF